VTVFWRYWLLQVPAWGVIVALVLIAHRYFGFSLVWGASILILWIVKDWAIYPMLKKHYRFRSDDPVRALVGQSAVAQEALRPRGYVRLRGELWLAELAGNSAAVLPGDDVIVEAIDGLTLRVAKRTSLNASLREPPARSASE
jgi:membrane protein implicated in regulation of membrane protease activity